MHTRTPSPKPNKKKLFVACIIVKYFTDIYSLSLSALILTYYHFVAWWLGENWTHLEERAEQFIDRKITEWDESHWEEVRG